ncbi:MAG: DUF4105 domain-containing protein [Pirellulaceae bacterium]|nr:DUF4105 domain-containing protein [Pirellulaceae bacterium]
MLVCVLASLAAGCATLQKQPEAKPPTAGLVEPLKLQPSNQRNWEPSLALLPRAELSSDQATVRNIRRFTYLGEHDYVMDYYDRTFDLNELESLDFIVVPFKSSPSLAHTMLSFGWRDGEHLVVSVEVRLEEGQEYSTLLGALHQFELTYVVGHERDLILLRTDQRDVDVYLYRTRATPEQTRALFVDVMRRVNKLEREPEFYDTLNNNCTTNIVRHINAVFPGRIPWDIRWVLPGYSDRLAYDLGLLDTSLPFEECRRQARINERAKESRRDPEFSARIRKRAP